MSVGYASAAFADLTPAVESVHATVSAERSPADDIPSSINRGVFEGFDFQTSHLVGESQNARYWSVAKNDGDICLVLVPTGQEDFAAATCSDTKRFAQYGLTLAVEGTDESASFAAFMLPDTAAGQAMPPGLHAVSAVLAESDLATAQKGASVESKSPNAPAVILRGIGRVG
ncbi:hypothetical protein DCE93_01230 [Agromyces badenianii]|uniref:Uncharacterized protein n=2 Tax=Agromyces badenianii TaxID=2080742 RepID=A0A2S0WT42_9MICO|nr:hypothetical protein DCE93_01230 [Agromyces badenianii]